LLQRVDRASHTQPPTIQHMRVYHRGRDVAVAQKLLNRADIVPRLEQMRRKRVPQGMTARILGNPARPERFLERALHHRLVQMMSASLRSNSLLLLSAGGSYGLLGPRAQLLGILEQVSRYLVILHRVAIVPIRAERPHPPRLIVATIHIVEPEVKKVVRH